MKNIKEIMEHYSFHWDSNEELWKRPEGFGRVSTVDNVLGKIFIIKKDKKKVYDHFIEGFDQFKEIIKSNFS